MTEETKKTLIKLQATIIAKAKAQSEKVSELSRKGKTLDTIAEAKRVEGLLEAYDLISELLRSS